MNVLIEETKSVESVKAKIIRAKKKDMPLKKNGWRFNWRQLYRNADETAEFYKLIITDEPNEVQGMVSITVRLGEMTVMNQVETAPWNYGKKKKFDHVVGCLLALAYKRSFELGKNNYVGYLAFESKTDLIPLYVQKYGAVWTMMGANMFFDVTGGQQLIEKYLGIKIK